MEDFLAEVDTPATVTTGKKSTTHVKPTGHDKETWTLHTNSVSSKAGSWAGLVLRIPSGHDFKYALKFDFEASNNESEYKALLAAKEESMKLYMEQVNKILPYFGSFSINHIQRGMNVQADAVSKLLALSFEHVGKDIIVEVKRIQEFKDSLLVTSQVRGNT
ncbi:hypothetical protein Tco_0595689 [Tanacetum coccineum]